MTQNSKPDLQPKRSANPELAFQWRFLGPRYWGIWILLLLLWLLMFTPRRWLMRLGAWVGDKFRQRNGKRRRIVEVNLKLCFPELTDAERDKLCIKHFRAYGRSLVDMGLSLWGSEKRLRRLVRVEGLEDHLHSLGERKVVLVTWHMTTMEICANIASLSGPSVSMMKSMENPVLTWQFARGRCHLSPLELILRSQGLRPLVRGLGEGKQCILIPDEDLAGINVRTMFIPFFGVDRATLLTPVRLARSAGAVIVTCAARLNPESGTYVCTFLPVEQIDQSNPESVLIAINDSLERFIRLAPEQYMWTFRWFQSRPNGAKSPYETIPPK